MQRRVGVALAVHGRGLRGRAPRREGGVARADVRSREMLKLRCSHRRTRARREQPHKRGEVVPGRAAELVPRHSARAQHHRLDDLLGGLAGVEDRRREVPRPVQQPSRLEVLLRCDPRHVRERSRFEPGELLRQVAPRRAHGERR